MTVRTIDIPTSIDDTLAGWGSDMMQRADAVQVLAPFCKKTGDNVVFNLPDGTAVPIDSDDVRAYLEKNKPHLLPRKFESSLADQAFLGRGNRTKMQELVREVGIDQAHKIARTYGRKNAFDAATIGTAPTDDDGGNAKSKKDKSTNPWLDDSAAGEARRIAVIKSLGTKVAAGLAKSAGKDIAGRPLRGAA